MTRIIQGVFGFQKRVFGEKEELFQKLGKGQNPLALFITCSDSRINPNLLTQTEPGELFILRNAGNLVPPSGNGPGGEEATVEYAIKHLKIKDIILCGHSKCGAMNGLLSCALGNPPDPSIPAVNQWLSHAMPISTKVSNKSKEISGDQLLSYCIEQNVLQQMENLKTYSSVQSALADGKLRLHSWVYRIETGEVLAFDMEKHAFVSLDKAKKQTWKETSTDKPVVLSEFDISI